MDWAAPVPAWIEAIATVAAGGAALFAYRQIASQLTQSDRHHREQLQVSSRPLIIVEAPIAEQIWLGKPAVLAGHSITLTIRNIGPGLARDVRIDAWVRETAGLVVGLNDIEKLDEPRSTIDFDSPEFFLRVGPMGAGDSVRLPLNPTGPLAQLHDRPVLYYMAIYDDIFGTRYPTVPKKDWVAGSVLFPPRWQTSRHATSTVMEPWRQEPRA